VPQRVLVTTEANLRRIAKTGLLLRLGLEAFKVSHATLLTLFTVAEHDSCTGGHLTVNVEVTYLVHVCHRTQVNILLLFLFDAGVGRFRILLRDSVGGQLGVGAAADRRFAALIDRAGLVAAVSKIWYVKLAAEFAGAPLSEHRPTRLSLHLAIFSLALTTL
jgi:hypothetical protein